VRDDDELGGTVAPVADGLIIGSALVRRLGGAEGRPRSEVVAEIGRMIAEFSSTLEAVEARDRGGQTS